MGVVYCSVDKIFAAWPPNLGGRERNLTFSLLPVYNNPYCNDRKSKRDSAPSEPGQWEPVA